MAKICFAADSCVSLNGRSMPFGGIKVLALPLAYAAPPRTGGSAVPAWQTTYGLAFAGYYLPAFLLKELVADVLSHLQGIGGPAQASFDKVCRLVAKIHRHLHKAIYGTLEYGGELDFFLGGLCPSTQRVRVAKFFTSADGQPQWAEVLLGSGERFEAIGTDDACQRFHQLMAANLSAPPCRVHFAVWHRLRDIICDPQIKWVDGAIQYGEFDSAGAFELCGSAMLEMKDGGPNFRNFVRGTDLEAVHEPVLPDDLYVSYPYMMPFAEEVGAFESDAFSFQERRYPLDELITVIPFEAGWPDNAAAEIEFLRHSFAPARAIEHIGSTAVAGMAAVPTIDVAVGVDRLWPEREPAVSLEHRQYEYVGSARLPDRRLYRRRDGGSFNIHVCEYQGAFWKSAVALRELLRNRADLAQDYSRQKLRILNVSAWTLFSYNRRKALMLGQLAAEAGAPFA